jgi:hypothetical protein
MQKLNNCTKKSPSGDLGVIDSCRVYFSEIINNPQTKLILGTFYQDKKRRGFESLSHRSFECHREHSLPEALEGNSTVNL